MARSWWALPTLLAGRLAVIQEKPHRSNFKRSMSEESTEQNRKGIPIYGDWKEPAIHDPAIEQDSTVWLGSNDISFKLLRCLEALRDLSVSMDILSRLDKPCDEKRLVKQIASPLYALSSGVLDMFNELESNAKDYITVDAKQHKEILSRKAKFLSDVPIDNKSDLRIVRDKIDSHIDKDAVIHPRKFWSKVNLPFFLNLIGHCLDQILYLLSFDIYSWIRESGHPEIWSLMSVDGTLINLYMRDGEPMAIVSVTFVKSPKYGILNEIKKFTILHNKVTIKCKGSFLIAIDEPEKLSNNDPS